MKVAIIGASTSGLFAGYLLARRGFEVEIYEKESPLGFVPRTLITTYKIKEIFDFLPKEAVLNRIRRIELFSRSNQASLQLSEPDLVIERGKLVQLLASQAQRVGARIFFGYAFTSYQQEGGKISINLSQVETGKRVSVESDVLVGADGALGLVGAPSQDGFGGASLLQARIRLPDDADPGTCRIWFDCNRTRYFFWLIPESEGSAIVGLIAEDDQKARASLAHFLKEKGWAPLDFQGGTAPLHRFRYSARGQVERNVFLVGDAAAQVKITTVGGLVPGLGGARALANALLNGGNYEKELKGLKRELDLHLLLRFILDRFGNDDYDKLVGLLKGDLKRLLESWTRDELRTGFWRLVFTEPRLITLGARVLFR